MDTSQLIVLLRTKRAMAAHGRKFAAVGTDGKYSRDLQFVYAQPADHLLLVCAIDHGETYEYIDVEDATFLGLTEEEALKIGWQNTLARMGGGTHFEKMPEFGWIPSTAGTDECVSLFADDKVIRMLPVEGRHLAFVPNTRGFWVTGTENRTGIALLCNIVLSEYQNPDAKPLMPFPMVLGDDGNWHDWLPPTDHPCYWQVRDLQLQYAHSLYAEQQQVIAENGASDDRACVAAHSIHQYGDPNQPISFSSAVWADAETLLPKVDLVELKPLLNRQAMKQGENVAPQYGNSFRVAWDKLVAVAGDHLRPAGTYPERYRVPPFSGSPLAERLQQVAIQSPYELFPGFSPSKRARSRAAGSSSGGLLIGVLSLFALFVMGGTLLAMFIAYQLFVPPPNPNRAAFVPGNPAKQPARNFNQFNSNGPLKFAPLPAFEELGAAEQPLPLLTGVASEIVTPQEDRGTQLGFNDEALGAWLVGVRVISGDDWGGVLRSIQPIYQQDEKYQLGEFIGEANGRKQAQLLAKPDYAVSGMAIQRGLVVNAVRLTYSRVVDDHFDLTDSYQSDWFGVDDGREQQLISSSGSPVIGLAGRYEGGCFDVLALTIAAPKRDPAAAKNAEAEWSPVGEFPELAAAEVELPTLEIAGRELVASSNDGSNGARLSSTDHDGGGWLVGFRVTTGKEWGGVISALQPIYQTGSRYETGKRIGSPGGVRQTQVLAKPGYAVARQELQRGLVVNCIRITFARVEDKHLDLTDSYTTSWLGNSDERTAEMQMSDGHPVIGWAHSFDGTCFEDLRLRAAR